jgi:predicted acetyltransferase
MTGRLVSLEPTHRDALELFLQDFDRCREEMNGYFLERDADIDSVVADLTDWAAGINLKEGWVPCTTWFWEEDDALQGVINVRHRLSPELEKEGGHIGYSVAPSFRRRGVATRMLSAALSICPSLGIKRALLTCDTNNIGSCRTIETNGGVLERESAETPDKRSSRLYWIDLET